MLYAGGRMASTLLLLVIVYFEFDSLNPCVSKLSSALTIHNFEMDYHFFICCSSLILSLAVGFNLEDQNHGDDFRFKHWQ